MTGLRLSPWGAVMDCRRDVLSYGGELLAGANYCGLNEESLRLGFNLVMAEWAA